MNELLLKTSLDILKSLMANSNKLDGVKDTNMLVDISITMAIRLIKRSNNYEVEDDHK
jgi:hypothetical protein